jgi:hypothetical protein
MFIFFTSYVWAAGRFVYEFTPLLFIPTFAALAVVWDKLRERSFFRVLAFTCLLLLFVANMVMGLVSALNGVVRPG